MIKGVINMKKFNTITFIFFIFASFCSKAMEYETSLEPFSSDLIGIAHNSTSILCYGNNGIIMQSDINANDWKQIYIGERDSIIKIINYQETYIGITKNYLMKSTDNGTNWTKYKFPKINNDMINMTILKDTIFLLTKNGIFSLNLNLNVILKYYNFDKTLDNTFYEFESNENSLFFFRYNLINHKLYLSNLDVNTRSIIEKEIRYEINDDFIATSDIKSLSLKIDENETISIFVNYKFVGFYGLKTKIYKYQQTSDSLNLLYDNQNDNYRFVNSYEIFNNNTYIISPDTLNYINLYNVNETGDITLITSEAIDRLIFPSYSLLNGNVLFGKQKINKFCFINDSLIIAVDNRKVILKSTNSGKSWNVISYFNLPNFAANEYGPTLLSQTPNNIYILQTENNNQYLQILKSTNGGVTWYPQKGKELTYSNNSKSFICNNNNGKIYIIIVNSDSVDKIKCFYSEDYGDNFVSFPIENLFGQNNVDSEFISKSYSFDDRYIIQTLNNKNPHTSKGSPYKTSLFILDKDFNYQNKVTLDSLLVYNISYNMYDNSYYLIGLRQTQFMETDSGYYFNNKLVLLKSNDGGKKWTDTKINLLITFDFYTLFKGERYYDETVETLYLNNKFIIHNANKSSGIDRVTYDNKIYSIDLTTFSIDSTHIITPDNINNIFILKGQPFIYSNGSDYLYHVNIYNSPIAIDDSIKINDILPFYNKFDNVIFNFLSIGSDLWFFLGEKDYSAVGTTNYNLKIVPYRIRFNKLVSVSEAQTERSDVYLYNEPPYPIPADNQVSTMIYWNNKYDIQRAKYELYNIYGEKYENIRIKLQPESNYSGRLTIDFGEIPSGVYLLQVKLGNEQKSIPIIIKR